MKKNYRLVLLLLAAFWLLAAAPSALSAPPQRVVSLVPAVSEVIFRLGAGHLLKGLTYHTNLPQAADKTIVGGFFSPNLERIAALKPDLIFIADRHQAVRQRFAGPACQVVELKASSIGDIYRNLETVGRLLGRQDQAAAEIKRIKGQLALVAAKLKAVPASQRLRVMRLMGEKEVRTPGDDSFQNDFIRLAGGQPPKLGSAGGAVAMSLEQWRAFDPQVVYGCDDLGEAKKLLERPGWREVQAVRQGRLLSFPCDLTCRASVNSGLFVTWLAYSLYGKLWSQQNSWVEPNGLLASRPLRLALPYLKKAQVVDSRIDDLVHKTLLLDFQQPMEVLSTLDGPRRVSSLGNHYLPPPSWPLMAGQGLEQMRAQISRVLGRSPQGTCLLLTGVDMDHLALASATFKDMSVHALATAGVKSNAMRAGAETGGFHEPGTINLILLTSRRLSPRAMARALITATEAKSAALQDLDIRSAALPALYQATGTGTDNIAVVSGQGAPAELTGGHSKLGELMARAVHQAVTQAVRQQNGLTRGRSIFHRLQERGLGMFSLVALAGGGPDMVGRLEGLLFQPRYASLVESALALSDAEQRGQLSDLEGFEQRCLQAAGQIAGRPLQRLPQLQWPPQTPRPLRAALAALLAGLKLGAPIAPVCPEQAQDDCGN